MSIVPHFLLSTGGLSPYVNELTHVFNETVQIVSSLIPLPDCDVVFRDYPGGTILGYGVGGRTFNQHEIAVALDVRQLHLSTTLHERVQRSLTHELHHTARMMKTGPWKSLGENIISEGLAQHFAEEIDHLSPAAWSVALSDMELPEYIEKSKLSFDDESYDHFLWFYGSDPQQVPKWAGYSVGYALVGAYLHDHPQETAATLFAADANVFI